MSNSVFSAWYFAFISLFFPKLNVMFKFNYSKYNPRGEGLIHGRSFPFQKFVSKRLGAYTRWGLLSEFYGNLIHSFSLFSFIFFTKNIVFRTEAGYSYFLADFRLKIFLRIFLVSGISVTWNFLFLK